MTTLHRYILLIVAAIIAAAAGGCATTQLTSVYRDPGLAQVPFHKVLVVFQSANAQLRRTLELRMAGQIANAVPAHAIFSDDEVRDVALVRARLKEQGFDSTVVMRLAGIERDVTYVPGQFYSVPPGWHSGWGYWGYGWRTVYEPGYMRADRVVRVATNVYSVADDKLVFASQSETINPSSLGEVVSEVVTAASKATGEALKTRG